MRQRALGRERRVSETPNPTASHCGSGVGMSPGWEFSYLGSVLALLLPRFALSRPFAQPQFSHWK